MPLQSLSRLLPEMSYLPTARICLGLALPFLFLSLANVRRIAPVLFILAPCLALAVKILPPKLSPVRPLAGGTSMKPLVDAFAGDRSLLPKLFSPSYAVFKKTGSSRLAKLGALGRIEAHSFPPGSIGGHASPKNDLFPLAFDGNLKTRWTTGLGGQNGMEKMDLEFAAAEGEPLEALKLELERYSSDFPRGLRVSAYDASGELCEEIDETPWEGPILFTPAGFPYFGPQQDVSFELVNGCRVKKLHIEQTGTGPLFDWSVAEILGACPDKCP